MSRVHLVQTSLTWEDIPANLAHFDRLLSGISDGLVILPEMFTTGFSMAAEGLAEPMTGQAVSWLRQKASDQGIHLCGSVMIRDSGNCYNRLILADPAGTIACYDKRHLFRMSGEHRHYAAGTTVTPWLVGELRYLPQVCYDLRFPVFSRNRGHYDGLLYVANWPAARRIHWLTLLRARAVENLCYVVGVNRIGEDGNGVNYTGDSCIIDPQGEVLLDLGAEDMIGSADLSADRLEQWRESFPAYLDADDFDLKT